MSENRLPFITLDDKFNIVDAHQDIKDNYSGLLMPDFFRNLLAGYDMEYFSQPVEFDTSLLNMSNIRLVFFRDGDVLKCLPVKSETYGTDSSRNVHYQMREPISSIFAMLPLLAVSINKGDAAKAFSNLDVVNRQSYKLLKNVNNVSLASKIMSGKLPEKEYVDFSQLIESVATSVKAVERNVDIATDIDDGICLHINRSFITNGLLNLISNSINFTADSKIDISIGLKRTDNGAVFTYSDNSKGIQGEILPYVFTPYFSKDPFNDGQADPSMGLGLFITKTAFEQAGGKILLTSVFGKGVKYSISLPECQPGGDMLESSATDFLLNRYSELFIQLSDSCILPSLKQNI